MQTKKNIFLWSMYDFANSVISIVFFLYFSQWIVVDRGIPDLQYNLSFTASAIILFLTAPFMGALLDKSMRRITGIRYTTVFTAVFFAACALFAIAGREVAALISYTLGLYMYLLSFTFYTPLLNDIAGHDRRGVVSGFGIAANYLGQIVGLIMVMPFANGAVSLFSAEPRAETLLPAVAIFFLFSLPMLFFFQEPKKAPDASTVRAHIRHTFSETRLLLAAPSVAIFLLSFFLFNDAILTASNNFAIFLDQVWGISDTTKTYLMLGILVTCGIGGLISGRIADRFGHKRTLVVIVAGWIILLPLVGLITDFALFIVATVLMGLWYGSSWTVSRSVMSYVAPKGKHNLAYSYFGLAERASSFLGPIVWGLVLAQFLHLGSGRYRLVMVVMTGFIVLGLLALLRVRDDRAGQQL